VTTVVDREHLYSCLSFTALPFSLAFVWESTAAKTQYVLDPAGARTGPGLSNTPTLDLKCYGMGVLCEPFGPYGGKFDENAVCLRRLEGSRPDQRTITSSRGDFPPPSRVAAGCDRLCPPSCRNTLRCPVNICRSPTSASGSTGSPPTQLRRKRLGSIGKRNRRHTSRICFC